MVDLWIWVDFGGEMCGGVYAFGDKRRILGYERLSAYEERPVIPNEAGLFILLDALDDMGECYEESLVIRTNGNWLSRDGNWEVLTDTVLALGQRARDRLSRFAGWEVRRILRKDIEAGVGPLPFR